MAPTPSRKAPVDIDGTDYQAQWQDVIAKAKAKRTGALPHTGDKPSQRLADGSSTSRLNPADKTDEGKVVDAPQTPQSLAKGSSTSRSNSKARQDAAGPPHTGEDLQRLSKKPSTSSLSNAMKKTAKPSPDIGVPAQPLSPRRSVRSKSPSASPSVSHEPHIGESITPADEPSSPRPSAKAKGKQRATDDNDPVEEAGAAEIRAILAKFQAEEAARFSKKAEEQATTPTVAVSDTRSDTKSDAESDAESDFSNVDQEEGTLLSQRQRLALIQRRKQADQLRKFRHYRTPAGPFTKIDQVVEEKFDIAFITILRPSARMMDLRAQRALQNVCDNADEGTIRFHNFRRKWVIQVDGDDYYDAKSAADILLATLKAIRFP
ncbi:hypothetical protein SLS58_004662 [Diplodia intermedia]|uniref:Uncharacterized protein n=1 Tax=Diplodia intermedia TaxID=856260 RepID=A0ABR3TT81_9PEZI